MAGESAREVARRARERAERLERRAEMFERGADGEEATAAALSVLPPTWATLHDVRWPTRRLANIDHIVIGPGGVFVIDTKNWSGDVSVAGGHLRQNGRSREKSVASAADAGLAIAELVVPYVRDVASVLCFADQVGVEGWCRDVMVCSTDNLVQMLLTRPVVIGPEQVTDVWLRLDAQLRSAMTAPADPGPQPRRARPAPRPVRPTVRPRRSRSRKRNTSVSFLVSVVGLVVFAALGPSIATSIGGIVAGIATRDLAPDSSCVTDAQASPGPKTRPSAGRHGRAMTRQGHKKARTGSTAKQRVARARVTEKPSSVVDAAGKC